MSDVIVFKKEVTEHNKLGYRSISTLDGKKGQVNLLKLFQYMTAIRATWC